MQARVLLAALGAASLALLAACSSSGGNETHDMPGMTSPMSGSSMSSSEHSGMDGMSSGSGLSATDSGYTFTLRSKLMSGMAMPLTFVITRTASR